MNLFWRWKFRWAFVELFRTLRSSQQGGERISLGYRVVEGLDRRDELLCVRWLDWFDARVGSKYLSDEDIRWDFKGQIKVRWEVIPFVIMFVRHEIETIDIIAHCFILLFCWKITMFSEDFAFHRDNFIQRCKSIMSNIFCKRNLLLSLRTAGHNDLNIDKTFEV
jgi:hypothetical protein